MIRKKLLQLAINMALATLTPEYVGNIIRALLAKLGWDAARFDATDSEDQKAAIVAASFQADILDWLFDQIENAVEQTETKVDDAIALGILGMLRQVWNIPDNDEQPDTGSPAPTAPAAAPVDEAPPAASTADDDKAAARARAADEQKA